MYFIPGTSRHSARQAYKTAERITETLFYAVFHDYGPARISPIGWWATRKFHIVIPDVQQR